MLKSEQFLETNFKDLVFRDKLQIVQREKKQSSDHLKDSTIIAVLNACSQLAIEYKGTAQGIKLPALE